MDPYKEIREALKNQNRSITWLAETIGTSQQSLSRNLNDKNLSLEKYFKIVEILGLTLNYQNRIADLENEILQLKVKLRLNYIAWATVKRYGFIPIEFINELLETLKPGSSLPGYDHNAERDLSQNSFDIERLLYIRRMLTDLEEGKKEY